MRYNKCNKCVPGSGRKKVQVDRFAADAGQNKSAPNPPSFRPARPKVAYEVIAHARRNVFRLCTDQPLALLRVFRCFSDTRQKTSMPLFFRTHTVDTRAEFEHQPIPKHGQISRRRCPLRWHFFFRYYGETSQPSSIRTPRRGFAAMLCRTAIVCEQERFGEHEVHRRHIRCVQVCIVTMSVGRFRESTLLHTVKSLHLRITHFSTTKSLSLFSPFRSHTLRMVQRFYWWICMESCTRWWTHRWFNGQSRTSATPVRSPIISMPLPNVPEMAISHPPFRPDVPHGTRFNEYSVLRGQFQPSRFKAG